MEPLPVIPLAYALPDESARRFRMALWVCEVLGLAVCAIAFALLYPKVESVLVTGPLIALIGSAMVGMAVHRRDWARVGLGAGHIGVCVLLIALVNLLNWSPGEAEMPFKWIGGCYLTATACASVAIFLHARTNPGDARLPLRSPPVIS